jgi:hypothetical protein
MALSGDYVVVKVDGTAFADGDIVSVDLGLAYEQHDVSGFNLGLHDVVNGLMLAPITLRGYLTTDADTGTHTLLSGAYAAGSQVTLEVQVGQNAAPQAGDPAFAGTYLVSGYKQTLATGGAVMFEAALVPAVGAGAGAPQWGVVA